MAGEGWVGARNFSFCGQTTQMKAIEQYYHVIPFIMPYKGVETFQCVVETLVCGHSNESY